MGWTTIGASRGSSSIRVLHMSLGRPFTSAEQEPHLAALQFQRTARSGARWPWMWWIASRTTMPSSTGTRYSFSSPPEASPRKTCITASATRPSSPSRFHRGGLRLEQRAELVGHRGQRRLSHAHFLALERGHAVDFPERG